MSFPLDASGSAKFISDGHGGTIATVILGPTVYPTSWQIDRMVVTTTNTNVLQSRLNVYRGMISPSRVVDSTYTGDQNVSETSIALACLDTLAFVWTGGSIGSVATVILSGTVNGR